MANQESRLSETRREFTGEKDAEPLIEWLNTTPNKAAKERVEYLLAKMTALEKDRHGYSEAWVKSSLREINGQLSGYTMVPKMRVIGLTEPMLRQEMQTLGSNFWERNMIPSPLGVWASVDNERYGPHARDNEFYVVGKVLDLAQSGVLLKLGKCQCGLFFYQRFKHQNSCSEKCRLKHYKSTEEWKEKRRVWARENYRTRKIIESGSKAAAQLKRKRTSK